MSHCGTHHDHPQCTETQEQGDWGQAFSITQEETGGTTKEPMPVTYTKRHQAPYANEPEGFHEEGQGPTAVIPGVP